MTVCMCVCVCTTLMPVWAAYLFLLPDALAQKAPRLRPAHLGEKCMQVWGEPAYVILESPFHHQASGGSEQDP